MDLLVLAIAFVVILLGAELFTNGIEWFGHKLNLAQGAVGSVLAAVGTALPETMIPIIAIAFGGGGEETDAVGVGAILGAPFMLSTLAMFVTGVGVIYWRGRRPSGTAMVVDTGVLVHDIRYFVIAYGIAIATAFLPPELGWVRVVVAVLLLGIYAYYVKGHFDAEAGESDAQDLAPLRLHGLDPRGRRVDPAIPRLRIVNLQVVVALACIVGGAYLFVGAVEHLATTLGVSQLLLALVIAPDRDRAAGEVQLADLGAPGQGHARDGQHHGGDGLPVGHPDGHRAGLRGRVVARERGLADRVPVGRHRVPRGGRDLRADVAPTQPRRAVAARRRGALPPLSRHRRARHRRGPADRLRSAPGGTRRARC